MLDSRQLLVFVTLAQTLNMRLAASTLGLTTSGVSHALKTLENNLGCQLLIREPRRLSLSPAGEIFLLEARSILGQMDSARLRIQGWTAPQPSRLRLFAGPAISRCVLGPALREIRDSFPNLTLALSNPPRPFHPGSLQPSEASELLAPPGLLWLPESSPTTGLDSVPLGSDELRFFAHPLHPWVVRRKVDRAELGRSRLVLPTEGSTTATRIRNHFKEEGLDLQPFLEVEDDLTAVEMIRLDLGAGILPRWVAAQAVREGHLVELPLGRRRLKRDWSVLFPRGHPLSLPESLIVDLTRKMFREISPVDDAPIPPSAPDLPLDSDRSPTESVPQPPLPPLAQAVEPVAF